MVQNFSRIYAFKKNSYDITLLYFYPIMDIQRIFQTNPRVMHPPHSAPVIRWLKLRLPC